MTAASDLRPEAPEIAATQYRPRRDGLPDQRSVPFFFSPRLDSVISTVPLPAKLAAEARGVSDDPQNPMLASYGANVLKGWLRAHPQTAQKHYPSLLK